MAADVVSGPMGDSTVLVFLRGFATPPAAYTALLAPLRAVGVAVAVPNFYGLNGYIGRYTAVDEASDTLALLREIHEPVVLAGHSRGGQVAWRTAQLLAAAGTGADVDLRALVLIDPVDGAGPRARGRLATATPASFTTPTLIVGAGIGGTCAPERANYSTFASATPTATLVVIDDMGHADILNGRRAALGRRLCGGSENPSAVREEVSSLLAATYAEGMEHPDAD